MQQNTSDSTLLGVGAFFVILVVFGVITYQYAKANKKHKQKTVEYQKSQTSKEKAEQKQAGKRNLLRVGGLVAGVVVGSRLFGIVGAISCGALGGFIAHRLEQDIWKN